MPMPTSWDSHTATLERVAVTQLGLRAHWLHLHLVQPALEVTTPRDRELLTMVATAPHGTRRSALVDLQRRLGTTVPEATRWIDRLVRQGWLSAISDDDPTDPRIDIPAADRSWIEQKIDELT